MEPTWTEILDKANALANKGVFSEALDHCQTVSENFSKNKPAQKKAQKITSKFKLITGLYNGYAKTMGVDPQGVLPKRVLDQVMSKHQELEFQDAVNTPKARPSGSAKSRNKAHQLYLQEQQKQALRSYLNAVPNSLANLTFAPILVGETPQGFNLYRAGSIFFAVSNRHKNVRYFNDTAYVISGDHKQTWRSRITNNFLRFTYFNVAAPLYHFIRHIYNFVWRKILKNILLKILSILIRYKVFFAELYTDHPLGRKVSSLTAPSLSKLKKKLKITPRQNI